MLYILYIAVASTATIAQNDALLVRCKNVQKPASFLLLGEKQICWPVTYCRFRFDVSLDYDLVIILKSKRIFLHTYIHMYASYIVVHGTVMTVLHVERVVDMEEEFIEC